MSLPARLAREPLVHFLAAGAALFAIFWVARGPEAADVNDTTIVVDRAALLTHMQYRANVFEPVAFGALLDAMSDEEIAQLVDDYVEEEALSREAETLGLFESDYIIRQRMIQKMQFLLGDLGADDAIDEAALAAYFQANREAYAVAPSATFTHAYFDADRRGDDGARQAAAAALAGLNASGAGFNDATGGDRFPFLRNYVERTFDYVASQFGSEFASALSGLQPSSTEWRGPIRSAYGWHVVLLTAREPEALPDLDAVRGQVEADYLRDASDERLAQAVAALRARYTVRVEDLRSAEAP